MSRIAWLHAERRSPLTFGSVVAAVVRQGSAGIAITAQLPEIEAAARPAVAVPLRM